MQQHIVLIIAALILLVAIGLVAWNRKRIRRDRERAAAERVREYFAQHREELIAEWQRETNRRMRNEQKEDDSR